MKSSMRRPFLATALVTALVLSGCGRDGGQNAQEAGEAIGDGKASGNITVWAMGAEGENLSTMADAFMADNPDATVKVTPVPWDSAHDKISTAIAGGETPDLALVGSTWMGEFARTGGLDPLPPDLAEAGDFFEGAWDSTVVDDVSYGLPWYVETRLLYVNKDIAAKAGITSPPKDWAELADAVEAFQSKGDAEWGISLQPGGTGSWQTILPFVWQNGGEVVDGEKFNFDTDATTEAFEYYQSYFDDGLAPTDLPEGALEPDFVDDKIGAFVSGPWHMWMLDELDAGDDYELWPMPVEEAGTSFVGGGNLAVFSDAKNRDGAWKFVSYLAQPEVQIEWYKTAAALPAVTAAWDDAALADDDKLSLFGEQLEDAKSPPTIASWAQIESIFDGEMEKLIEGEVTAAEAAEAIQQEATAVGMGD